MIRFPMLSETFRKDYFEIVPFLAKNCFSVDPHAWAILDDALFHVDPSVDYIKLLKNGRIDQAEFTEEFMDIGVRRRRIRKDVLYSRLRDGASLVLNRFDIVSPRVADICLELGRFVGAQTSANGYASFGGEPALNVHWDTHDVFVVQMQGRKHWRLYEPTHPLPISVQVSNDRKDEVPKEHWLDVVVEAGDVLYVPRGWWHRVAPIDGEETFHLTVAIHTPLILDYLIWACAHILPDHLEIRRSLIARPGDAEAVSTATSIITRALMAPETLQAFHDRARARDRVASPFNIKGLLSDGLARLSPECRLRINSRYRETSGDPRVNGRIRRLSTPQRKVFDALAQAHDMSLGELAGRAKDFSNDQLSTILEELIGADVVALLDMDAAVQAPLNGPAETRPLAVGVNS